MCRGQYGPSLRKAMEILVAIGDIYDAPRLIDVGSVHVSGVSYRSADESGARLAEEFASSGNRFVVPTSSNVIGMDSNRWKELGFPQDLVLNQNRVLETYRRMGIDFTHTCTPYYSGCVPRTGEHIAWAETSAIVFANSVLGARTNRESNPTAVSSALTGKTPLYGYRVAENRAGSVLVEVSCDIQDSSGYSALGFCMGSQLGSEVPVFVFEKTRPDIDDLKSLGAALATSGDVALFHVAGVTPEAPDRESAFQGHKPTDKIRVGNGDIRKVYERFSAAGDGEADHIMIGCPHASLPELREVATILEGQRVHPHVNAWICTSLAVRNVAERTGIVQTIESTGAHVLTDTCTVAAPTKEMGFETMATNSTKAAKYGSEKNDLKVFVGSLREVLRCAIDGRLE
jgi:hypothetical protein